MLSAGITSSLLVQILGAFRCGSCLLVIGVQNPIHSILLLIRVFFLGTLLLFTIQREYFGVLFLIVYVGAIVVLFLFIIRRLEIKRVNVSRRFRDLFAYRHLIVGLVLIEVLLLLTQDFFDLGVFFALDPSFFTTDSHSRSATLTEGNFYLDWSKLLQRTDQLRALGGLLYTEYKLSIILASLLLFLARVGAIAVTLPSTDLPSNLTPEPDDDLQTPNKISEGKLSIKRQDPNRQAIRHPSLLSNAFRGLFEYCRVECIFYPYVFSCLWLSIFLMTAYINRVRNPLVAVITNHVDTYPTPINLSYFWSFGSVSGIALIVQIVTGVCLARHYAPEIHLAFTSVEHIRRDVRGGSALRYVHANGASRFFIVVYSHRFRNLYYGSYQQPRSLLWYSGIIIFVRRRATAFRGYVLPWGQRSFWGATVITNLFSAIPGIGNSIVQLLWGGFSVDNPTLNRFFSLHYFLPFATAALALLHIVLLHQQGSNNPLGISSVYDKLPFYPYFYVKDLFAFFLFVLFFSFFVVYAPNLLGHPDNYIEANPLVTPAHIVPEWYFLPFYAILRTIPDKLGGVVLRGLAIAILAVLPVVDTSNFRSTFFKPFHLWIFWFFVCDTLCLGWIGQEVVESPFIERANFVTLSYFAYFIPVLPLVGYLENAIIQRELQR